MNKAIELVIKFQAGSDFQYECAKGAFESIGKAVVAHNTGAHKGNVCLYSVILPDDNAEDIGKEVIKSSSSMHDFCKDAAAKIANFKTIESFPLTGEDLKPFFEVIAEEVENLMQGK